jgi:hypothetical protein
MDSQSPLSGSHLEKSEPDRNGASTNHDMQDNWSAYSSLDHSAHQIRLFKILPSKNDGAVIDIQMSTFSLPEEPNYLALSYVWGDPSMTKDTGVNGKSMPITINLASALK